MHTLSPSRFVGIFLLICIIVPAALAIDPLWTVKASPGQDLSAVAISQDGSTVVAGGDQLILISSEGTRLWSGFSGNLLEVNRDGRYIVTAQGASVRLISRDGIMLWDHSLGDTVTGLSITPDGALVAAGGGNVVQAWYNSGSGLGRNTTDRVNDVKISPAKDQIIVATVKALRGYNLSYIQNWYDDTFAPGPFELAEDGTDIAIPNGNHILMFHSGGKLLWDRSFPGGNIISLAYSRDGSTLVAGRDDSTILVINRDGNVRWNGKAGYWISSVGISDDGSVIVTGSIDNQIHVFNRQGTLLGSYRTKAPIRSRSVSVSGDGSLIVAVDISNVYGFSRSQFTRPVPVPVPESTGNVSVRPPYENATLNTTIPVAETFPSISVNASFPATGTSPSSEFPLILTLIPLAIVLRFLKK